MPIFRRASAAPEPNGQRPASFKLRSSLIAGVAALALGAAAAAIHAVNGNAAPGTGPGITRASNLSALAPAAAMPSFADLVDNVRHAVVSVRVRTKTGTELASDGDDLNPFKGTPFEKFFRGGPGESGDGAPSEAPKSAKRYTQGLGSGFLITADGYIVTNNHVVENAVKVEIVMDDGTVVAAKVIGTDPKTDLALIKIDHGSNLPYVTLADAAPRVGEWVVAMGNPYGLGGTVTAGIVSAQGRDIGSGPFDSYIQIDAPVNRGNSGGPTFNMSGQVIGVNTAIYSPSGGSIGIAFDIPASTVKTVTAELKDRGRVERGWLGVEVQPVTPEVADSLGLKDAAGALVSGVQPASPAARAGLGSGDIIAEVDGTAIKDTRDLARSVGAIKPGNTVKLTVRRGNKTETVAIRLEAAKETVVRKASTEEQGGDKFGHLGITVAPAGSVRGVGAAGLAILSIDPDGAVADLGFAPGDVIVKAGGRDVSSVVDLERAMADARSSGRRHTLLLVKRDTSERYVAVPVAAG